VAFPPSSVDPGWSCAGSAWALSAPEVGQLVAPLVATACVVVADMAAAALVAAVLGWFGIT
jgi:hypothetical protein